MGFSKHKYPTTVGRQAAAHCEAAPWQNLRFRLTASPFCAIKRFYFATAQTFNVHLSTSCSYRSHLSSPLLFTLCSLSLEPALGCSTSGMPLAMKGRGQENQVTVK